MCGLVVVIGQKLIQAIKYAEKTAEGLFNPWLRHEQCLAAHWHSGSFLPRTVARQMVFLIDNTCLSLHII